MFIKKLFLNTFVQFCYRHMHFERSLYYFSKFSVDIVNLFGHDKRVVEIWYNFTANSSWYVEKKCL